MSLTAGDLQILYHMAVEESRKNAEQKGKEEKKGNTSIDSKSAEIIEDAVRGDI